MSPYTNQLGGLRQRSTTDAGVYLTHIICAGWLRQCYTSVIVFDIAQFFLSLNHKFLSICLKKAGLNTNVVGFFNSYHSNCSTTYIWNKFSSPAFNTNVSIGQGSALFPILSAIYLAPVTNFIRPYLHQFFDDSHGLKASLKPLRRPFNWYQSCLEAVNNSWDIRQINW